MFNKIYQKKILKPYHEELLSDKGYIIKMTEFIKSTSNENTTIENLRSSFKAVIKENFMALNTCINKN